MLCEQCQQVIIAARNKLEGTSKSTGSPNETKSYRDLQRSAREQCYACAVVLKEYNSLLSEVLAREPTVIEAEKPLLQCHSQPWDRKHFPLLTQTLKFNFDSYNGLIALTTLAASRFPKSMSFVVGEISESPQDLLSAESSTSASGCLDQIQDWLDVCINEHSKICDPQQFPGNIFFPSRLLDLAPSGLMDWRLVLTAVEPPKGPYVTLSYRWGTGPSTTLSRTTFEHMCEGQSADSLPGVFQDAITVTKHLGVRYLWIDSICIFQDDEADFQREASSMSEVYTNAILNIAATTASHDGFFVDRNPAMVGPKATLASIESSDPPASRYQIIDGDIWKREVSKSLLCRRGWVFQEQVLAKRVVYFGKIQVLWQCQCSSACETYPSLSPNLHMNESRGRFKENISSGDTIDFMKHRRLATGVNPNFRQSGSIDSIHSGWHECISEYNKRNLSHPQDKLLAISGIAKRFNNSLNDEYLAGIWRSRMLRDLTWRVISAVRPSVYRAPSWSWASLDAPIISFEDFEPEINRTVSRILVATVESLANDFFGQLRGGHLSLEAPFLPLKPLGKTTDAAHTGEVDWHSPEDLSLSLDTAYYPDLHNYVDEFYLAFTQADSYSGITYCQRRMKGLILRKLYRDSAEKFERVGMFDFDKKFYRNFTEKPKLGPTWMPSEWQLFGHESFETFEQGRETAPFDLDGADYLKTLTII